MADRKPLLDDAAMAFVKGNGFQPHPDAPTPSPVEQDTTPTPAPVEAEALPKRRRLPKPEPKESTVRFTVDLRESQHDELKRAALDAKMPMTKLIRHIISDWLAEE